MKVTEINQYGVSQGTFYNQVRQRPELLTLTTFTFRPHGLLIRDLSRFVETYRKVMKRDLCR